MSHHLSLRISGMRFLLLETNEDEKEQSQDVNFCVSIRHLGA
jgi:hypothetical protein